MFIPGWNSLDSVRRVHSDLELIALVFFALLVLFEVLAFLEKEHTKKTLLETIGLWFFAVAVLAELIAYPYGQRNDTLSAQVIGSLDVKAQRAADNASKASTDSSTALSQAQDAAVLASNAKLESDRATAKAGDADSIARRVDDEAETLGKRTETLQAQGDSLQKLINAAKDDLTVLKMSRQLQNTTEWFSSLNTYNGIEYAFSDVFADAESIRLLLSVDAMLRYVGWKRVPLPPSEAKMASPIAISPFADCPNCFVPLSYREGVAVEIEEPNPPSAPVMTPLYSEPEYIQAASRLHRELFGGLFPRDGASGSMYVITLKGDSRVVLIGVGSKPEPTNPYDPKVWQKMMESRSQTAKP